MNPLIEKIRKARESRLTVGDFTLTIRRPTDLESVEMRYTGNREAVCGVSRFVVDWHGVRELDIAPGGTDKEVPFDSDLFAVWIEDQPKLWEPLINGVLDAYKLHAAKHEADAKN